jgi:hypothetical protein
MTTSRKGFRPNGAPKPRNSSGRAQKKHAVPTGRGERHMGAMENQVSATMPPRADDDEPKQG